MGLGVWVLGDHCKGLGFRVLATSAIEFYDACSKIGRAVPVFKHIKPHKAVLPPTSTFVRWAADPGVAGHHLLDDQHPCDPHPGSRSPETD